MPEVGFHVPQRLTNSLQLLRGAGILLEFSELLIRLRRPDESGRRLTLLVVVVRGVLSE